MRTKINVTILSIDLESNEQYVLLHNGQCPCNYLTLQQQPIILAQQVLATYVDTDPDWLQMALIDVYIEDDMLSIDYVVMIPKTLPIKLGQWTLFLKVLNEDNTEVKKRIQKASTRI